jgi:hypothetical protein
MYSDPSLIRRHTVKLSFSDREFDLVNAFCAYTGEEKAPLLRELAIQQALLALGHGGNHADQAAELPRSFQGRFAA